MKKIHETKHTKKYNCIHCVVILGETTVRQNGLHFESSSSTAAPMVKVYEEKSQYCDSCSETFSKQSQLTTQIRSTHEKEKSPCNSSGKVFSKRRHLKLHRTPLCQACDYKFSQWSDLAKHSDQHSEVQQCQYIECFKQLHPSNNLRNHVYTNHRGLSALLCSFCGKQFKQKDALQKHEEDHVRIRGAAVGNQIMTTQELQRSAPITIPQTTAPIPPDLSTPPDSRDCSHVVLFHLPSMLYTPVGGREVWLNSHQPVQHSHWKMTLNIDVPAIDSTTELLDIRHLDSDKILPNDTQRSSLVEELE